MRAGDVAVITGAASGLGLALAQLAAGSGMHVVMADIETIPLLEAAAIVSKHGSRVVARTIDVGRPEAVDGLARTVLAECGPPHLVVNNAGVGLGGPLWEHSSADWDWVLGVNLLGVAHGVRAFTPSMLAAAGSDPNYRGAIVNTASMAGLVPMRGMGAYGISKHAVIALSEILARDLALVTRQVHAAVLCPYFVPTRIGFSRRNRPGPVDRPPRSQRVHDVIIQRATQDSPVSAAAVARAVFDALEAKRFYIFTDDRLHSEAVQRAACILSGENPPEPVSGHPRRAAEV